VVGFSFSVPVFVDATLMQPRLQKWARRHQGSEISRNLGAMRKG
jgi:hypothetical protein